MPDKTKYNHYQAYLHGNNCVVAIALSLTLPAALRLQCAEHLSLVHAHESGQRYQCACMMNEVVVQLRAVDDGAAAISDVDQDV